MVRKRYSTSRDPQTLTDSSISSEKERPRLLFVVNDPAFFLSHRLVIARAAMAAGFSVFVATPVGPGIDDIRSEGFTFVPIRLERWGMNPFSEVLALLGLIKAYRKVRPHIVHHVTIKPVLYGSLVARITGVPAVVNAISGLGYIFIAQGCLAAIRKRLIQHVYRFVLRHKNSRVVFQNPDDRDFFISSGLIAPEDYVLIQGSGVDTLKFAPADTAHTIPVVLMVARLLRDKGVYEFVDAARQLKRAGIRVRCIIAGSPATGNPAAVSAVQLEVWRAEGIIELPGHVADMPSLYQKADIVCLPSYREGLPKALIEGASAGKALVATDVPGCREIVRPGRNGYLVSLGDSVGLARALGVLIEDEQLRNRMGEMSRDIILSEGFAEEHVVAKTMQLYRSLLKPLGISMPDPISSSVGEAAYMH